MTLQQALRRRGGRWTKGSIQYLLTQKADAGLASANKSLKLIRTIVRKPDGAAADGANASFDRAASGSKLDDSQSGERGRGRRVAASCSYSRNQVYLHIVTLSASINRLAEVRAQTVSQTFRNQRKCGGSCYDSVLSVGHNSRQ